MLKELLQKINEIESTKKEIVNEAASMSINASGETADEVARLVQILQGATAAEPKQTPVDIKMLTPKPMPMPMGPDMDNDMDSMKKAMKIVGPKPFDDPKIPGKDDVPGDKDITSGSCMDDTDYANEPDEDYKDTKYMTKDLSGGLNRQKDKGALRAKDPAIKAEEIKSQLASKLESMMSELEEGKVALPTGAEVKKCHDDGMSKKEIMDKYSDCDKEKMEKLYASNCG